MATDTEKRKKLFLEALDKSLANISKACHLSGVARATVYKWINDDPDFSKAISDMNEVVLDFVEAQLFKQIQEGNATAIIFFLKTRGKKRGYVERQEITGADSERVVIQVHGNL
jgi:hypothetical protein